MTRPDSGLFDEVWSEADLSANPHAAADKAARVQRMFGAIAKRYDLNNRLHSFGRDQFWRRRAVALAEVKPGDRVLDAACGTGDLAVAMARAGAGEVIGVDFTPEMLELARVKAARSGDPRRAPEFQRADVTSLPFEDAAFDVVSIAFGIRNVDRPERALAEFHRVLRPGGRLVILEFAQPESRLIRRLNRFYTRRVMPVTATLLAGDRSGAYRYLPRSIETFLDPEAMREALGEAGFADVRVERLTFGVCAAYRAVRG